jgi:alpha-glucosidase (family GH31 glycosyl hydrolase)
VLIPSFLLGPGFLVSPVLEEGSTSREAYFPDARWFDYRTGAETFNRGRSVDLNAPMDYIPLHVRGSVIYPTQEPALNTMLSRQNPLGLIVAPDDNGRAQGTLYYDDGESLDSYDSGKYYLARYVYENGNLETIVENDGYPIMASLKYQTIRVLGSNASRAMVNGKEIHMIKSYSGEIRLNNLNLPANKPFQIKLV